MSDHDDLSRWLGIVEDVLASVGKDDEAIEVQTYRLKLKLIANRPVPPGVKALHTVVPVQYGKEPDGAELRAPMPMCWEHGPECLVSKAAQGAL